MRRDLRATGERFLVAGMALLVVLLFFLTRESRAQVPGLGMGWILNPEGSRLFPQAIIYPRRLDPEADEPTDALGRTNRSPTLG